MCHGFVFLVKVIVRFIIKMKWSYYYFSNLAYYRLNTYKKKKLWTHHQMMVCLFGKEEEDLIKRFGVMKRRKIIWKREREDIRDYLGPHVGPTCVNRSYCITLTVTTSFVCYINILKSLLPNIENFSKFVTYLYNFP